MSSSLFESWKAGAFRDRSLKNIVDLFAGGELSDGSDGSRQFRKLLSSEYCLPEDLKRFASDARNRKRRFDGSGFALQDIVNEVGRRLDFFVTFGRYRGISLGPGHDGLWQLERSNRSLVVEIKTTASDFLISLDTIAEYRTQLIASGEIARENETAMLIVVGRGDTEEVENQIRGSRHAWDMRLISVDSLLQLMFLRTESNNNQEVTDKIHNLLFPTEFTRLDKIVEMAFVATSHIVKAKEKRRAAKATGQDHDALISQVNRFEPFKGKSLVRASMGRARYFYQTEDGIRVILYITTPIDYKPDKPNSWYVEIQDAHWEFFDMSKSYAAIWLRPDKGKHQPGKDGKILLIPSRDLRKWRTLFDVRKAWKGRKSLFHIHERREGLFHFRSSVEKDDHKELRLDEYLK